MRAQQMLMNVHELAVSSPDNIAKILQPCMQTL